MTLSNPDHSRSFFGRMFGVGTVEEADRYANVATAVSEVEVTSNAAPRLGLIASAQRLTSTATSSKKSSGSQEWQAEAWKLLDLIGEQRFLVHALAGRLGQAALYIGKVHGRMSPGTRPEHDKDPVLDSILEAIGDGPTGLSQLLKRLALNLLVAGEGWLVGIPPYLVPNTPQYAARNAPGAALVNREVTEAVIDDNVLDLSWRMLSTTELTVNQSGEATILLETGDKIVAPLSALYAIRVWQPHPERATEADSPTRSSLPVLRELLGLTQHIGAQIDSRLAGAGLLVVASSISTALKRAAGLEEGDVTDPLMESLIEAMMTPIQDRASASAVVPLTLTVPDDAVDKIKHITFSTPLDKESPKLRDEAIRRLALGQDAPPELLLGTGGMNHWGAWLVREDVVSTHLEPYLALICEALTTQYLRPILLEMGYQQEQVDEYVIWYDVDHMVARPNRSQDAKDNYNAGVITAQALREATGFEDGDAPETAAAVDPAVQIALDLLTKAPSLAQAPGLAVLVTQVRAALNGETVAVPEPAGQAPTGEAPAEGGIPATKDDPAPKGTPANPGGAQ